MIPTSIRPHLVPIPDESARNLDDPFIGLLGKGLSRDEIWLGKPAPRYTSYPPATAFQDGVSAESFRRALSAVAPEEPISLYIHVPFCKALCLYCGCHTTPTQHHERVTEYLDSVHREMEHLALLTPRARRISHIHFGGGSPNMMSEKDLGLMMGALARRFDLSSCDEVAMEIDPRLLTKAQARTLGLVGVSRVSLGVQDFNTDVQEAIRRIQPFDVIERAVGMLRDAGIDHINFDLMYGLPLQSPISLAETARLALSLKPDRIALFSYAHVPQVKKHQQVLEQFILPGPHASLALESAARSVFKEAGYVEIGIDHFARPRDSLAQAMFEGRLRRNFQGYTDDSAGCLVGLGASSIGRTTGGYFQNARDTDDYRTRVAQHGLGTARGLTLTGEDKLRAAIIEQLMCNMNVNVDALCRAFNYSPTALAPALEALKPFEEAGIIKRKGGTISLATPHRMAARVIAAAFDKTVRASDAPISRTV